MLTGGRKDCSHRLIVPRLPEGREESEAWTLFTPIISCARIHVNQIVVSSRSLRSGTSRLHPIGFEVAERPSAVQPIVGRQGQAAGQPGAPHEEPHGHVDRGIGFAVGARVHTDGAVGPILPPEPVAFLLVDRPFQHSSVKAHLVPGDSAGGAVVSALHADPAEVLDSQVNRAVGLEGHIRRDYAETYPRPVIFSHQDPHATHLAEPGLCRQGRRYDEVVSVDVGPGVPAEDAKVVSQAKAYLGRLQILP